MIIRRGLTPALVTVAVLTFGPTTANAIERAVHRTFTLRAQTEDGWTIDYKPLPARFKPLLIDGQYHLLFDGESNPDAGGEGAPQLPLDAVSLGIPFDANVTVELVNPAYVIMENQLVAPRPTVVPGNASGGMTVFRKNPQSYSRNTFVPDRQASITARYTFRLQRIATVRVAPYQYNPVTKTLRRLVSATLKIHVSSRSFRQTTGMPSLRRDPFGEPVYRSLLLNYDQAVQWRQIPRRQQRTDDPTRDWFKMGRTYYRIPVAADGWYKVTENALAAAGVSLFQVDFATLNVIQRGIRLPVWVGPDSSIQFYALRNYGDSAYYDFYTDTSVCWLTWGDTLGRRFTPAPPVLTPPSGTVQSALVTRHFEQNTDFYVGTGLVELGQNSPVPGRGWVWDYYYPGTTNTHTFALDAIDAVAFPTSTLRVRLFSTTLPYGGYDHKAKFWINDSVAGQVYFVGRTGVTFSAEFPTSWLHEGTNTIAIKSDTSVTTTNQFYLDWFEIDYGRTLRAKNNQLFFALPATGAANSRQASVAGFGNPRIDVFDLSDGRMIGGGVITGDSIAGYSISFRDTSLAAKEYLAVADSGPLAVLPLSAKMFGDIRTNGAGADYIVITHPDFVGPARQLASHRATLNGVRTAVISVQDIYDEFNYGVMNGEKIKDFLYYAYLNWPAPQPSSVLMFGGASWDSHGYLATTVKKDYVPAYGVPAGDNWYVCFSPDTSFFPSMYIGRLPVQDPIRAQQVVAKVIAYDTYTLGDWNKDYLFIAGGLDTVEQKSLDGISDNTVATYVNPPPIGGTAFRAYKFGPAVIDPGYKDYMKGLIQGGLVYVNYLGHSGGRTWEVDIGPPAELENTDGKLPFVSSVSCNVGAFAEPSNNCLSEDFVLGDNRGAIAMWASSALGYPYQGSALVNSFLEGVASDSLRDFGALTTLARIQLWASSPSYISISDMNLTPLLGDPLSRLAIPLKPDLAVFPADISLNTDTPTSLDTALTLHIRYRNFGLVPPDSIVASVSDLYNGRTVPVLASRRFAPTLHEDSLLLSWNVVDQPGKHTITVALDPNGLLDEVTRANNSASADLFIYASSLSVINPLDNSVVPPGARPLVVSSPVGGDTLSYSYAFELDTIPSFDSPFHGSATVSPGPVSGQWTTPLLGPNQLYFWRARTLSGSNLGRWVTSSFSTSPAVPSLPLIRWREFSRYQFARETAAQVSATDSGVTISTNPPVNLYARSLGYRADLNHDYYSLLKINQQTIFGLWWIIGNSFMTVRINQFTGAYDFRPYNVYGLPALADSMAAFINTTSVGDYFAISVIYDGSTNVNPNLRQAIKSLGSAYIDSLQPGHSWVLIGRKGSGGPGMTPLEQWSPNGVAQDSILIQNLYSLGSGSLTTTGVPVATSWSAFHWTQVGVPGVTTARVALLGVKVDGSTDTLRTLSQDSTDVSLSFLNQLTAGPAYTSVRSAALLSSSDALRTPALREWSMEFVPPADLAISPRTVGIPGFSVQRRTAANIPVTVYNIGYHQADSARIAIGLYDIYGVPHPLASATVDSIPVNGFRTVTIPIQTANLAKNVRLQVVVSPAGNSKDLTAQNNAVDYSFTVTGNDAVGVQVFADGTQLMDGDYVAATPTILVHLTDTPPPGQRTVELLVDGAVTTLVKRGVELRKGEKIENAAGDPTFTPTLPNGHHQLTILVVQHNTQGGLDTLQHGLSVNVTSEQRILQVYNYPNPFASETYFTFVLTGAQPPDEVTIRIFTVAGRKIRQLTLPRGAVQIGANRVHWDGRDNDGSEIANGYYLYQIQATGGGTTSTAIEKLARIR